MKKLSLLLLGSIGLIQAAQANIASFNGYYVGAQAGWTQRKDKLDLSGPLFNPAINFSKKANGLVYGIFAGYNQVHNNSFYWGVELGLEDDNASKEVTREINGTTAKAKFRRGARGTLAARFGVFMAPQSLVYLKLGAEYSRDKLEFKTSNTSDSKTKNHFTFVPGVGYECALTRNVRARIQYDYNIGKNISVKVANTESKLRVKYTAHAVKVGVVYSF